MICVLAGSVVSNIIILHNNYGSIYEFGSMHVHMLHDQILSQSMQIARHKMQEIQALGIVVLNPNQISLV